MISGVLIVKNEAENLPACLEALQQVAQEIIVVDHESTDDTKAIASKFGAKIYEKKWEGYAAGKNFGNQKASNNWILSIDADEVITKELATSILNLKLENKHKVYALDRANYYGEKLVKYCWSPDWKTRLFHKEAAHWQGNFVHETLKLDKSVQEVRLKGKLKHYSYANAEDHFKRIERYAKLSAEEMISKGKQVSWLKKRLSPSFRFIKTYFLKKGFLDGALGWEMSKRNAYLVRRKYEWFETMKNEKST